MPSILLLAFGSQDSLFENNGSVFPLCIILGVYTNGKISECPSVNDLWNMDWKGHVSNQGA